MAAMNFPILPISAQNGNAGLSHSSHSLLKENGRSLTGKREDENPSEFEVVVQPGARVFRLIGTKPYIRKDGTPVTLAVWNGNCRECGQPFEIATPMPWTAGFAGTKAFLRAHCDAHKQIRRGQP